MSYLTGRGGVDPGPNIRVSTWGGGLQNLPESPAS